MTGRRSLRRSPRGIAAGALVVLVLLVGCGRSPSDETALEGAATVEHVEGSEVARITLTEGAVARLDIQTTPVQVTGRRLVVPSAAVLLDPTGVFWVYTSPESLVFVRHKIEIDREEDGQAYLLSGPEAGTEVVTVGVAELYGAEFEIGH